MKPAFILLLCLISIMQHVLKAQHLSEELDSLLNKHISREDPGVAVLVWKDGRSEYMKGFGRERLDKPVMIGPATTFRMASVSKQFTAMGIMLLEKDGKIDFGDKISRFFPELNPALTSRITVRNLLTHTSGIIDYEELMDSTWQRQIMDGDIVRLLINQTTTYFEPGTKFRYSNTGFCLLAMIVERVSGKPYRTFMQERIFKPLMMKNTFLYDSRHPDQSRALGYARDKAGNIVDSDQSLTSATLGDGCVYTSLTDYLIWYKALRANTLVNLAEEIKEVGFKFPNQTNSGYGLGWFYSASEGTKLEMSHTGSTCGFSNLVVLIPQEDLLIVCFSNLADNHSIFDNIVNIVKEDKRFDFEMNWLRMHRMTN
jgi:CubicO group peptidase (beta-lactamase class C family)